MTKKKKKKKKGGEKGKNKKKKKKKKKNQSYTMGFPSLLTEKQLLAFILLELNMFHKIY